MLLQANPIILIGHAAKLGKEYALLVVFCVVVVALAWLTEVMGTIGFTAPLLATALTNFKNAARFPRCTRRARRRRRPRRFPQGSPCRACFEETTTVATPV
jgi:hypothetical protein